MSDARSLGRTDLDILRHLTGADVPGLAWGAAMSVSISYLENCGFVSREVAEGATRYVITKEGRECLRERDAAGTGPG